MTTLEAARGRWKDILLALGIGGRFLVNKHGPCPCCGGKDRFRFDNKDGTGSYFCNQCGAGDGLMLLRKFHGWDFKTAVDQIDGVIGRAKYEAPKSTPEPNDKRKADIEKALAGASAPELVRDYLSRRGLSVFPEILRGHPALPFFDENHKFAGTYPAMLCPIVGPDGKLQSAQRIYLSEAIPKKNRKKLMPKVETVSGATARLFPHADTLGLSEGIETAIAAHELFRVPVWAAITAAGIESFAPPPGIKRLIVYADNDANFQGQKSAYALAHKLSVAKTIERIEIEVPPRTDSDWLDVLAEDRA